MNDLPRFESTPISGLLRITLDHRTDSRGWFQEVWQKRKWAFSPIAWFRPVQQNSSANLLPGSIRGMHAEPWNKLVTVVSGKAFCCWVDLRAGAEFGSTHWSAIEPGTAFFVPEGVANGYQSLESNTVYTYLVDDYWSPNRKYSAFNPFDSSLNLPWPIPHHDSIISTKDAQSPSLLEIAPISKPKALVCGPSGQLGQEIMRIFPDSDSISHLDAFNISQSSQSYQVIINAAAYTNVEEAEASVNWTSAREGNQLLVARLAKLAIDNRAIFVHFSSDYVFDGTKNEPWTEEDPPNPLSRYGISKLLGDYASTSSKKSYLIRTSWVFGEGRNFIRTMFERARTGQPSNVVADQFGRPTWAGSLAEFVGHLLNSHAPYGTYNFSNSGEPVSWYDLAAFVYEYVGKDASLVSKITSKQFSALHPTTPDRPANSVLCLDKANKTGFEIADWRLTVSNYLDAQISRQLA